MPDGYEYEYTDTVGGQANYCWLHEGEVQADNLREALRKARKAIGLSGVKGDIVGDFGDEIHWKPRGCCTILMVR